jgi:hypothetical protein
MAEKKEIKKITVGLIFSWIFGIIFILAGLGKFTSGSYIPGIIIILCSAMIIPYFSKKISKNFNFKISGGVKFLLFIVIIIVSGISASNMSESNTQEAKTPGKIQPTTQEKITQEKEVQIEKIYTMNDKINVDYLTYTIQKAETFTEMGSSIFNKKTNGKFVKIYIEIMNDAKETKDIFTPRFKIEDNQGRKFDRLSDDILYIADSISFGQQLQPGLSVSGAVVFELPKNTEDLNLIITGDWLSNTEIKVYLNDIKEIGKDTTQQEEQDKMIEDLMNQCNAPLKCSSSCKEYMGVGQKDCPSGQVCCMEQ